MNAELDKGEEQADVAVQVDEAPEAAAGVGVVGSEEQVELGGEDGEGAPRRAAQEMLYAVARTVALGALKHTQRYRDSEQMRHVCVRLWDGWMRTASLQMELEAARWLERTAMARAVLQPSRPTTLPVLTAESRPEGTADPERLGRRHSRSSRTSRSRTSSRSSRQA